MIQNCTYLYPSNFTPQVKQARNQSQVFNRKSISRQFLHLIQIEYLISSTVRFLSITHCRGKLVGANACCIFDVTPAVKKLLVRGDCRAISQKTD